MALLEGESLRESSAAAAMMEIMEGAATPAQIAGFVVALRAKGETTDEIVGLVETMRSYGEKVEASGEVLDTCGTGGDRAGTFNVSTAAALVCAGAGVKVAKHGNRAASSRSHPMRWRAASSAPASASASRPCSIPPCVTRWPRAASSESRPRSTSSA